MSRGTEETAAATAAQAEALAEAQAEAEPEPAAQETTGAATLVAGAAAAEEDRRPVQATSAESHGRSEAGSGAAKKASALLATRGRKDSDARTSPTRCRERFMFFLVAKNGNIADGHGCQYN